MDDNRNLSIKNIASNIIRKPRVRKAVIILITLLVFTTGVSLLLGGQWVTFYGNSIHGTVIDADTNQPIEGVIVVGLWRLSEVPGEGFGGYAKVSMVKTNKKGNFTIPCWIRFKPWKFYMIMHELAPDLAIYKPGYKFHWSHKISREGFPHDISMTEDEKRMMREKYSIKPAKLHKVNTDEERIQNYHDWGKAGFPGANFPFNHFTIWQTNTIVGALKVELLQLSDKNIDKKPILNRLDKLN
jgi:hypothetical protein